MFIYSVVQKQLLKMNSVISYADFIASCFKWWHMLGYVYIQTTCYCKLNLWFCHIYQCHSNKILFAWCWLFIDIMAVFEGKKSGITILNCNWLSQMNFMLDINSGPFMQFCANICAHIEHCKTNPWSSCSILPQLMKTIYGRNQSTK
jgi:hypothetical protein